MKHIYRSLYMVCLLWVFGLPSVCGQVFLPYDAKGVTEQQKVSNPSRLAYPTRMLKQIEDEVEMDCGKVGDGLGPFSVSETKKVYFSRGNLQYNAALGSHQCADGTTQPGTWRFAEHQWDYVGDATNGTVYYNGEKCNNSNISSSYNGWIDLFGWGTGHNPTLSSKANGAYSTFIDWGENSINNGGNTPNLWRTLSFEESKYLCLHRVNAANLKGKAIVMEVAGYVLLPDNWDGAKGLSFIPGNDMDFSTNSYTMEQWTIMESFGAVFFPMRGGVRIGTYIHSAGVAGDYWSATGDNAEMAYSYYLDTYGHSEIFYGRSVRLVTDAHESEPSKEIAFSFSIRGSGKVVINDKDTYDEQDLKVDDETYLYIVLWEDKIPFTIKLQAIPNEGYTFSKWSDGSTDNPRTVNVTEDMELIAIFTPIGGKGIGVFSISETKKVTFAPGNLQYQASTNTWRFAEHQWDMVGYNNKNISPSYSDWIDLFGWGTGDTPTNNSKENSDYPTFVDWGTNLISNGGNTPNQWRTLTNEEWVYLCETRKDAASKYGAARVNEVNGVVILPDEWTLPAGCLFVSGMPKTPKGDWSNVSTTNIYTENQWKNMENYGAVFLPCAGGRGYYSVENVETEGNYCAAPSSDGYCYGLTIYSMKLFVQQYTRWAGNSVRLVSDLE